MNRNGVSTNEKKNLITIGLHVEAIDEDGNWCESEILNIIDNKIIVKFLKTKETYNKLFDISSDKWRFIANSQKNNHFSLTNDDFKKGDYVLAKWHDGNYYLSEILDITSKTKFGTKVKEYHIVYLYDNVEETVTHNRLKSTKNAENTITIDSNLKNNRLMTPANFVGKRPYRKRGIIDGLESDNTSDNVFYDEKTKKFTENCKIRRLRLSQVGEKVKNESDFQLSDFNNKVNKDEPSENELKFDATKTNSNASNSAEKPHPNQRFSQRRRRSSYRKADYFYPDSVDHSQTDRNKSSNNVSQVSTPVIHESCEDIAKSPKLICPIFSNQTMSDSKDLIASSNHSPISVSLTSTEESPKQKPKLESSQSTELEIKEYDNQGLFSCNDDGQYSCLICTNKTFRKKKLVLEHIKYYHPRECPAIPTEPVEQLVVVPVTKTRYSPNKRYYSSYLKTNRSTFERKKHFSKLNKTKYKPFLNRALWNSHNSFSEKSSDLPNFPQTNMQPFPVENSELKTTNDKIGSNYRGTSSFKKQSSSIVFCHRCKKSTEDGCLVQCDLCLCWSHTLCYGLSENKDNSNFWECDNCANIPMNDAKKTHEWYRDRWRFHSVLQNELPWIPKSTSSKFQSNLKNICEMQSLLSLSQRVLEAITRNLDRLIFKTVGDSNSQDDFDYFKTLQVDENIDDRFESLDVLNLNSEHEELFKISCPGRPNNVNGSSNKHVNQNFSSNNSHFHFNEINFSNSTPIKPPHNGNKSVNTSLDALDIDIQSLEVLPKATFDALVNDLHSCGDIYKKNNSDSNSRSSILDLLYDNCNITNPNKQNEVQVSLDPDLPFSQPTSLDQNVEIIGPPEIYLSSDDLSKEISLCEELCDFDRHILPTNKYPTRDSMMGSSCSDYEAKSTELIASTSSFDQTNFHKLKPFRETNNKLISRPDTKLEIEFSDISAIIQPESSHINDPGTSTTFVDTEMGLSQNDSRCLHWLLCKFKCVEKIVDAVEKTLQSSESSASSDYVSSSSLESDYNRISKYLLSLLYILKKSQCQ